MLRTRSVRPSQIGPYRLEPPRQRAIVDQRAADALDAAGPRKRIGRTSMQPPAAAAVRGSIVDPGERVQHLKKNTKAGTWLRSARLAQRSLTISDVST